LVRTTISGFLLVMNDEDRPILGNRSPGVKFKCVLFS
jgi:hypothetical protein